MEKFCFFFVQNQTFCGASGGPQEAPHIHRELRTVPSPLQSLPCMLCAEHPLSSKMPSTFRKAVLDFQAGDLSQKCALQPLPIYPLPVHWPPSSTKLAILSRSKCMSCRMCCSARSSPSSNQGHYLASSLWRYRSQATSLDRSSCSSSACTFASDLHADPCQHCQGVTANHHC